jgi:hypothetical protein
MMRDLIDYFLELNQALWLGEQLDHSLINLNQIRSYGISLCEDPYDEHIHLGVQILEMIRCYLFEVEGNIVLMKTNHDIN